MTAPPKTLPISSRAAARLRAGHPWVFANEVATDLKAFEPGEAVSILAPDGRFLATGYVNPAVLIAARVLSRRREPVDRRFLERRLTEAVNYRERVLADPRFGRLVYSESDGLPGFIVDRYDDVFVIQTLTAGAARLEAELLNVLREQHSARAIVLANDAPARELEGLSPERRVAVGELSGPLVVEELGLLYEVDPLGGQKTGHYHDQRENRRLFANLVSGEAVLDLFCYEGSWALVAARKGISAIGRDASRRALKAARRNAELNGLSERCRFERADLLQGPIFDDADRSRFDAVVLDPPPLARNRKSRLSALRTMVRLVRDAALMVKPGGLLVACSCSHHVSAEDLRGAVAEGGAKAKRQLRIITRGGQSPDHPVLPAAPETEYLHALFLEVRGS